MNEKAENDVTLLWLVISERDVGEVQPRRFQRAEGHRAV